VRYPFVMDFIHNLANALPVFVMFLFSLCFHEFSHAFVANLRGDPTAQMMGRMTLNPVAHADLLGTVILPLIGLMSPYPMLGWARPVPVDERNLKHPRQDMFWIAFAGPLSNLLLATIGIFGYVFYSAFNGLPVGIEYWPRFMTLFVLMNLGLAVFNMIPVAPLDGSKVLARFLPESLNRKLEENQQAMSMILIVLLFMGGFRYLYGPVVMIFEGIAVVATRLVG
jgi:Zn-dependent protease